MPFNTLEVVKWLPASDAHVAQGYRPVTRSRAEGHARPISLQLIVLFFSTFLAITVAIAFHLPSKKGENGKLVKHNSGLSPEKNHCENCHVMGFSQSVSRQQCCNGINWVYGRRLLSAIADVYCEDVYDHQICFYACMFLNIQTS